MTADPTPSRAGRALIVIPTVDEAATIMTAIAGARAAGAEVLVVDDGSVDGTLDLVSDAAAQDEGVHLRARGERLGLGSAYREGLAWGCEQGFSVVGEMDADLSHDPEDLGRLLAAVGLCGGQDGSATAGADVAIGSRYIDGGGVVDWPLRRRVLSRAGNLYVRLLTGLPVADATAGYRVYRCEVIQALDLSSIAADGYAFQVEMALRSWQAGFRIREVPITFTERREGASKMNRSIVLEALWRVPVWAVSDRLGQRRSTGRHRRQNASGRPNGRG